MGVVYVGQPTVPLGPRELRAVHGAHNVREYGARCDGTFHPISEAYGTLAEAQAYFGAFVTALTQSLDWAAFQKAANLCDAAGGGEIHWAGTAIFGTPSGANQYLVLYDNTTLAGIGALSVIKRADDTVVATTSLITNEARAASLGGTGNGTFNDNIHLRDFVVDGGNVAAGATDWIGQDFLQSIWLVRVTNPSILNVECRDGRYNGMVLEYCRDGSVTNSRFLRNLKNGVYLSGSDRITFTNSHGHDNGQVGGTLGAGFAVAASWHATFNGCTGFGNAQGGLMFGRDSQCLTVNGGALETIDTFVEPASGDLPWQADHVFPDGTTMQTAAWDGLTNMGGHRSSLNGVTLTGKAGWSSLRLFDCGDVNLNDVLITGAGRFGAQVFGCTRVTFRGGKIQNCGQDAVSGQQAGIQIVASSLYPTSDTVRVIGTEIDDTQAVATTLIGVVVSQQAGGTITGTELEGVRVGDAIASPFGATAGVPISLRRCSWAETSVQALAYSADWTPDASLGDLIAMTLTGNTIVQAPTNGRVGQWLTLVFTQDATGSRAITLSSAFRNAPPTNRSPAGVTAMAFQYVGSTVWVAGAQTRLTQSAPWDPPSVAAGATDTSKTVTVTGTQFGDRAEATLGRDLQGLVISAAVSAADTVTVQLTNPTAGAIDLGSATLRVFVFKES